MMMRTFAALAILSVSMSVIAGAAFAQQNGSSRPVVKVQPAPWIPTPQLPPSIFPASPSFNGAGSDFFPAGLTDLFDNTTLTGYYFPVSNITADDANIPNNLDSDGDTATAVWMTLTCWRCCSRSATRAAAWTRMSIATARSTTPTCWRCCSTSATGAKTLRAVGAWDRALTATSPPSIPRTKCAIIYRWAHGLLSPPTRRGHS
jgi:hypothetical protein